MGVFRLVQHVSLLSYVQYKLCIPWSKLSLNSFEPSVDLTCVPCHAMLAVGGVCATQVVFAVVHEYTDINHQHDAPIAYTALC
jgi:hypothetical protein